jgi:hypothetical protein
VALLLLAVAAGSAQARAVEDPFAEACSRETLEEGATAGLNHNPAAKKAFVPKVEERERERGQEGKRSKRATGQSPKRT